MQGVFHVCQVLGFNKSTFYYQPRIDASQEVLRSEIQRLAAAHPTYGYRRITKVLVAEGHTVGYKRVARLMKEANLSVSVKRACQTTHSTDGPQPWRNHLKDRSVDAIRCGWAISPTSTSSTASSISLCSWMSSPA